MHCLFRFNKNMKLLVCASFLLCAVFMSLTDAVTDDDLLPACYACVDYQKVVDKVPGCGCPLGLKWYSKTCKKLCKR